MIKIFDCFTGYGGAEFALNKARIEHECIGFSEIDKYAIQCFQQNHCKRIMDLPSETIYYPKNFGDITKINWKEVPDFDLLTGGFPCQDISQAGGQDLSKGRSILINELIRCLKEKQPKHFLFENVGAIETKPFKEFLRQIENDLRKAGYIVFRKMLNTKDFGVPQNRERVWWIGYRKDIYNKEFGWTPYPKQEELKIKLKDILEKEVDKKYYLKPEQVEKILKPQNSFKQRILQDKDTSSTLAARDYKEPKCIQLNNDERRSMDVRIYSSDGLAVTQSSCGGGLGAKTGLYAMGCAVCSWPRNSSHDENRCQRLELNEGEFANSLTSIQKDSLVSIYRHSFEGFKGYENISVPLKSSEGSGNQVIIKNENMVRRLTPKECFRLMGFLNDEINLEGLSDTQKYKLAGNGWDINLVSKIFEKMFF